MLNDKGYDPDLISEMPARGSLLFLEYNVEYRRSTTGIMSGVVFKNGLRVIGYFDDLEQLEKILIEHKLMSYFNMYLERTRLARV